MNTDLNFDCTKCGECCRNLKIPLTVAEALDWLADGNQVQILTEAIPWPDEPDDTDKLTLHKRERSFPVMSGTLPTRIVAILAASFAGSCPNLRPDMTCGIYQRRPLACRIYPAEANTLFELLPSNKKCPPEAWAPDCRPLLRQGEMINADFKEPISRSQLAARTDPVALAKLCAALGLDAAALVNEGFVLYSPAPQVLLQELKMAQSGSGNPAAVAQWRYISNRQRTIDVLAAAGASCFLVRCAENMPFEYLGFYALSHESAVHFQVEPS